MHAPAHVVFGESPDLHTAAHEAAHVVQQAHGVSLVAGSGPAGAAFVELRAPAARSPEAQLEMSQSQSRAQ